MHGISSSARVLSVVCLCTIVKWAEEVVVVTLQDVLALLFPVICQLSLGGHPSLLWRQIPHHHSETVEPDSLDQFALRGRFHFAVRVSTQFGTVPAWVCRTTLAAGEMLILLVASEVFTRLEIPGWLANIRTTLGVDAIITTP